MRKIRISALLFYWKVLMLNQFALVSRPPILLYVTMESFINYVIQNYPQGPYSLS